MSERSFVDTGEENATEWARLTSQGDQAAFTRLLRHYQGRVYGQALTYLRNTQLAQEITQDIFITVWNNRAKLGELQNFSNYLFIISRNAIISALRKKAPRFDSVPDELEENGWLPDLQLEHKQVYQGLMLAIDALPPVRQKVFRMSRLEGRSYEEIGAELGISRNGVKDHIVKALHFLRHHIRFESDGKWVVVFFLLKKFF